MKPKLALAIFLLVVSNLTAYRAGKRVADWWYLCHPLIMQMLPPKNFDCVTYTRIGDEMIFYNKVFAGGVPHCTSGGVEPKWEKESVGDDGCEWVKVAPKKPRKP